MITTPPPLEELISQVLHNCPTEAVEKLRPFVTALYRYTPTEDLAQRPAEQLCSAALSHLELFEQRGADESKVRAYSPAEQQRVWPSHSVVEIVTDDMPFLVDSVRMALNSHGLTVHLIAHSVLTVIRDATGRAIELDTSGQRGHAEAIMYLEVDRRTGAEGLEEVTTDIHKALDDVRAAVSDWPKMCARIHEILAELAAHPPPVDPDELEECKAFLEWIENHHFTFLGYRMYDLVQEDAEEVLIGIPGTELGTTPQAKAPFPSQTFASLSPEQRAAFRSPHLLVLTKANVRATVHRPVYMDYIGIKRFGADGTIIGEHRFLGLYTSAAYNLNPRDIPLVRRKVAAVIDSAGMAPASHNGKSLLNILETYPRDELLQIGKHALLDNALEILHLQERHRVRLFVRREAFGRFVSCIVYIPRERYDTTSRRCIQAVLMEAFNGESTDFTVHLSESVLARAYFIIHTPPGSPFAYDRGELEARIAACARTWNDELQGLLLETPDAQTGTTLCHRYAQAFPSAYRDEFHPNAAARDIEDMEQLRGSEAQRLALYRPLDADPGEFRFKLFSRGQAIELSDVLPILENMDVRVIRERPFQIRPADRPPLWIYDFSLRYGNSDALNLKEVKGLFQTTFAEVWRGAAENDGFNHLVLRAQLDCRNIVLLRAYAKYLRQTAIAFSQSYMEQALARNGQIARLLIELFDARFNPEQRARSATAASRLLAALQESLDAVERLDDDRILRSFLAAVQATVRTNFFQTSRHGDPKEYLSLKLDSSLIPELPVPRPMFEIFVYSPRVEGVHLRGGKVARGGIRWSDRHEDFRTEVLGLMKAQMVKNAIIVPVGAKGGFVVKHPPPGPDRDALREEVVRCYRTFIRGLLDLTDNLLGSKVVPPRRVVHYDGDDPYLVVAADKGTATFSDIANEIAGEYQFWLDDAFASGGSTGYDHKKMGITARGAWESVKRHFRELGTDVQTESFTVCGIGDMSGDVFGNGMLQSQKLRLLAAFDHRHIFIDPHPDSETSYRERARLFELPRSSWADYDPQLISEGGGVYPRSAKAVKLSPQARRALDISADSLPPDNLIRALLRAPVDLLWNGGIGTYIKSRVESNADVGDRSNDAVRINAIQLRCRVLAEGGNLGITQKGRIEYALNEGRINTDFIDNAGGVSCSDYEVNIKILLNAVTANGALTTATRNELLASMTQEVASLVLAENYWQSWAISFMQLQGHALLDEQTRFMHALEHEGKLDRALEDLPDDETLATRRAAGQGLTRPELAVLVTYAKNTLYQQLLASDACDDPFLTQELARYFPQRLQEQFSGHIEKHPLRRELIATFVTNRMVNRLGATFAFRMQEEHGIGIAQIVRAYLTAWNVFRLGALASEIASLDHRIPAGLQLQMMLAAAELVERGTSWLLRHGPEQISVIPTVECYTSHAPNLHEQLHELLPAEQRARINSDAQALVERGAPPELAQRIALLPLFYAIFDVVEIATETGVSANFIAKVYFALGAALELDWLGNHINDLPADDLWQARSQRNLEDELNSQLRAITTEILATGTATNDAVALLQSWSARGRVRLDRYHQMIIDLKNAPSVDMPMIWVALRELRTLTRGPNRKQSADPENSRMRQSSHHGIS